jgi:hypothetical protein
MTRETAAARSAALLRQLDASRQQRDDRMIHRPDCDRQGIAVERGHSCTIRRCLSCGSTTAERNVHQTPAPAPRS